MYLPSIQRCVSIAVVAWVTCVTRSLETVPDGPIGLPNNVSIRTEKVDIHRAKLHGKREKVSILAPAELDQGTKSDIVRSENLVKAMQTDYKEDERQGITAAPREGAQSALQELLPSYINSLPSNMLSAKRYITDTADALLKLGLQAVLSTRVFQKVSCSPESNEADLLVCVMDNVNRISKIVQTSTSILALNFRVLAGGTTGSEALTRLNTLAANPLNKKLMLSLGTTVPLYITLMRESVADETKTLAGSIMTQLTSIPVVSDIPDTASGGFGRVNIVIPRPSRVNRADYDIAKLEAGATERDLLAMNL